MIQMVPTASWFGSANGLKRMKFLQVQREQVPQQGSGPGSSELTENTVLSALLPACNCVRRTSLFNSRVILGSECVAFSKRTDLGSGTQMLRCHVAGGLAGSLVTQARPSHTWTMGVVTATAQRECIG